MSLFYILHGLLYWKLLPFWLSITELSLLTSSHSTLLAWLGPIFHQSLPLCIASTMPMMSHFHQQVSVATAQRLLSFSHCFHSTQVNASSLSLVCVDTAVCRTVCSSTPVQIQMGIILCYLVSTANPHCVWGPLQFYSRLVCCSTMLLMSVSTQSHLQCFVIALIYHIFCYL